MLNFFIAGLNVTNQESTISVLSAVSRLLPVVHHFLMPFPINLLAPIFT